MAIVMELVIVMEMVNVEVGAVMEVEEAEVTVLSF